MSNYSCYEDSKAVKQLVAYGRHMITLCEENKLYPKDDLMWNAAVVCGNKLTTIGTPWSRIKSVTDLTENERIALSHYLDIKG